MSNPDGRAHARNTTFKRAVEVTIDVRADAARVWAVLTNAADFGKWNSTVTSIEGRIARGEKLKVHVPGTSRVFSPTVTEFEPERRMVWRGGAAPMFLGVRTFELQPLDDHTTRFRMDEVFSGLMIALVGSSLPDFVPIFEAYAADLKRAVELAR